ncbi:unnamed protein product [Acanthoscelides obtectus]|uniref:Uncharacterized protein n=1 Tax=Acanthoscelides obtectus TaxID=200917 RepID=A0A9P0MKY6_ACAOB|nr:unnamed protein product [Acanthoscelides obtectus]CAK1659127.1 hypothetical protein AOBTE_LOCUS21294 [Acanthoscelides obtectus]
MNDLDRQLAELALINQAELAPGKKWGLLYRQNPKRISHRCHSRTP